MTDKVDYISNEQLKKAIIEWQTTGSKKNYNKMGKAFIQIANKLAESSTFNRYPDHIKENMIGEAIYKMIDKIENYDYKTYNNPFAYCTSLAFNVFRQHIKKYYANTERTVSLEQYLENNSLTPKDNKYADKMDNNRIRTNNTK